MNRREFLLKSSAVAVLGALGIRNLHAQAAPADMGTFTPLRGGAGCYTGRGGTIGWCVNADGITAVDTQFPEWAQKFLDGLPGRDARVVDLLINSHHHGDHTAGNPTFRPVTTSIVAHANVPRLQKAAALRNDAARGTNTKAAQVYADTTFETAWKRELGGETITATHFGPAHTGGDAIIHFEKANVIHMGDLVFNHWYPVTDRPGGCVIAKWIEVLEKSVKAYPADAIYIFGHFGGKFGPTGGHADILHFRDFLAAVMEHVRKGIAAGKSREEIVAMENFPGFDDFHVPAPNRLSGNLGAAYDELTATG
ncbi:MAG TPA: MBL fold metallo-hydrolase [Opitutaceae bacterium]